MRKRILFVDDEPLVLQGLQRMLRGLRNDYDMEFAASGPAALECLGQSAFDVIVSDMRMPGMNGAQLLQEVMQRHPQVVRLILSGHADRDLILECVGIAHQYLAKPCQAEALKTTIRRASSLESRLRNEALRQLVTRMKTLPSVPSLYTRIMETLRNPEVGVGEIAEIISRDPGMTAQMLKLVNSAFFGLGRPTSNIAEAVAYLGVETVKALVLSLQVFSQFQWFGVPGFSAEPIWRHSLEVAAIARALVRCEAGGRPMEDSAFVSGLLHDVGKLVFAANFPALFAQSWQPEAHDPQTAVAQELAVFKATHADLGGYLLGLWGLPVPVVEAIALHHQPAESDETTFGTLTAVHVADALAHAFASRKPGPPPGLDDAYLERLGSINRIEIWRREAEPIRAAAPDHEYQSPLC